MLDATLHHISGHQYEAMDLKPHLRNDTKQLDPEQVKQERSAKAAVFALAKDVREIHFPLRKFRHHFRKEVKSPLNVLFRQIFYLITPLHPGF